MHIHNRLTLIALLLVIFMLWYRQTHKPQSHIQPAVTMDPTAGVVPPKAYIVLPSHAMLHQVTTGVQCYGADPYDN